jgi:hypothetical protein
MKRIWTGRTCLEVTTFLATMLSGSLGVAIGALATFYVRMDDIRIFVVLVLLMWPVSALLWITAFAVGTLNEERREETQDE